MNKKHPKTFFRLLGYIFYYNPIKCIIATTSIIGSAILAIFATTLIQTLINDFIVPLKEVARPDYGPMYQFIIKMALMYFSGIVLLSISNNLMIYITHNTLNRMRRQMFIHMEKLPISYFDKNTHGNVMSRFTNDVDALRQMISQGLPSFLNVFVTIISVLVAMIILSIHLTLIAFMILSIIVLAITILNKKSRRYFVAQQATLGTLNGYVNEMISGQKVIKVFCHEEKVIEEFDRLNQELYVNARQANMISSLAMPILMNIGFISYTVVVIVGSLIAINFPDVLDLGSLATFMILLRSLTNPISHVSQQLNMIIMANAGAGRIFELLDQAPEEDHGQVHLVSVYEEGNQLVETDVDTNKWAWKSPINDLRIPLTLLKGDVVLKNVSFGYVADHLVLHNISLYAKPGQKIAFVGATGAGKTTITNLINRFYDIQAGEILIDGINIEDICKDDLRRALGIVLQDTNLFTGTIKENIRFGRPDATDQEVYAAAKLSNADTFIQSLPLGYDTVISGDGGNLSQGQRQLLSIARTAVSNPPVLILDEATSSIDTRTEKLVQEGMDRLMAGRTVFVIAHRLSTIKNAQAIMVLEKGRIIERGNHDELIALKGQYYRLYTGDFELE